MLVTEGLEEHFLGKAGAFGDTSRSQGGSVRDIAGLASTMSGSGFGYSTQVQPRRDIKAVGTQFGPGLAPQPQPLGGDPRQGQYRPSWNIPSLPGEGRPVSYEVLRAVADVEWLMRKAIEIRKNQITNLEWNIVPKPEIQKSYTLNKNITEQYSTAVLAAKSFFLKPDRRHWFDEWLRIVLEDHYVLDAVGLYRHRNQDPDAGPLNADGSGDHMGQLIALEPIDGSTIKPLLDDSGRRPLAPLPAYQQYLYGIPRFDFTDQELIYSVHNRRSMTPYGYSPVEQFLFLVNMQLRYWSNVSARYTDGTLPEGVAEAPPEWSQQQIEAVNEYWDRLMAGDPRALRKLHFVPAGFKWHTFKPQDFDHNFARLLIDLACITMDMTPAEFGLEPAHGNLGAGGSKAEQTKDINYRRGIQPTINFIKNSVLNPILWEEFGLTEFTWDVVDTQEEYDPQKVDALDKGIKNSTYAIDQIIEQNGGEAIGVGRVFALGQMLLSERDLQLIDAQGWAAFAKEVGAAGAPPVGQPGNPSEAKAGLATALAATPGPTAGHGSAPIPGTVHPVPPGPREGGVEGAAEAAVEGAREYSRESAREGARELSLETAREFARESANEMSKAAELDLGRWKGKALKAVKARKRADVKFDTDAIPADTQSAIRGLLSKAASPRDVHAAFAMEGARLTAGLKLQEAIDGELAARGYEDIPSPRREKVAAEPVIHVHTTAVVQPTTEQFRELLEDSSKKHSEAQEKSDRQHSEAMKAADAQHREDLAHAESRHQEQLALNKGGLVKMVEAVSQIKPQVFNLPAKPVIVEKVIEKLIEIPTATTVVEKAAAPDPTAYDIDYAPDGRMLGLKLKGRHDEHPT
jgi:hypothetical protein